MVESIISRYNPASLRVIEVYTCSLNPLGPTVGFALKMASSRHRIYVSYHELLNYLKEHKRIKNVEIFKRADPEGIQLEPLGIRSTTKSFSLSKGEHIKNIDSLQRKTWKGEIDTRNKVQMKFTILY